ncbi:hypothetical protein ANCCAN_29504 [Ancylostoma caninum]|uniref:Uncharacterized protein n=1 Tax=Ancylostoma caninum TaxID=29170 RepID=A0A368EYE7_ANCCA|nr:hypothetical protein ANCCAN_29504 [Ancylostoma caninum]
MSEIQFKYHETYICVIFPRGERLLEAFDAPTPTVDMVKPLKTPSEAQKRWMSIRRAKNGIAVVSDKSTDPLIHLSNPGADDPALPGMTPMATLPPGATCDDDLSLQSDMSSRPTTGRVLKQNGKSNVFSQMQGKCTWLCMVWLSRVPKTRVAGVLPYVSLT